MELQSRMRKLNQNLNTEINLVPIVDCFVILLCFLLLTFSITQLVHLQGTVTGNTLKAMAKSRGELDRFHLMVVLDEKGYELSLKSKHDANKNWKQSIPKLSGGAYDFALLHQEAIKIKSRNPDRFSIDIAVSSRVENSIKYEYIMSTMNSVRHLTTEEYNNMTAARKSMQGYPLLNREKKLQPELHLKALAKGLSSNESALKTDTKLLFPDIALVGVY